MFYFFFRKYRMDTVLTGNKSSSKYTARSQEHNLVMKVTLSDRET